LYIDTSCPQQICFSLPQSARAGSVSNGIAMSRYQHTIRTPMYEEYPLRRVKSKHVLLLTAQLIVSLSVYFYGQLNCSQISMAYLFRSFDNLNRRTATYPLCQRYCKGHEVSASWTLPPEPCGHLSMHTALHMPSTNKISLFRVSHGDTPGILPAFSCDSLA